jgi:hypothetical protein
VAGDHIEPARNSAIAGEVEKGEMGKWINGEMERGKTDFLPSSFSPFAHLSPISRLLG